MSGIEGILDEGRKTNFARCHMQPEPVKRSIKTCKNSREEDMTIHKLQFPGKLKYPDCHHERDFTLNRELLSSEEHIKVLARPRKTIHQSHPRWVVKKIPPCTLHLNELAQPKLANVVESFNRNLSHLDIFQIERFLNKMSRADYQTPQEALNVIKQRIRERQMRVRCQHVQVNKLHRQLLKKQMEEARKYTEYLASCFRSYITNDQVLSLTGDGARYSEAILRQICRLMKQNVPERDSCNLIDQIFCRIADKIAYWMLTFLEESGFRKINRSGSNDCMKGLLKDAYPIEDFYSPRDFEEVDQDKVADEATDVDDDQFEDATDDPQTIESDLFLRHSQVKVDQDDCTALFMKIAQYQKEKTKEDEDTESESDEAESEVDVEEESDDEMDETGKDGRQDGRRGKADNDEKAGKAKKARKADKDEKADKGGKTGKVVKAEKGGKANKAVNADKTVKADKDGKVHKDGKLDKGGKAIKADKDGKSARPGTAEKVRKPGKTVEEEKDGKAKKDAKAKKDGKSSEDGKKEKDSKKLDKGKGSKTKLDKDARGKSPKDKDKGKKDHKKKDGKDISNQKRGGKDKDKKKKGGKGGHGRDDSDSEEFDCYGNVNKNPQWDVEWVVRGNKF